MSIKRWVSLGVLIVMIGSTMPVQATEESQSENGIVLAEENNWIFNEVMTEGKTSIKLNESVMISADISGETEGLLYKFVWQKDNWKEWGVLQNFSDINNAEFIGKKAGDYTIYIDVKGVDGKVVTKQANVSVVTGSWEYVGITTDLKSPQEKYVTPINVKAEVKGETENLQYKFVWQKNNWASWGVIQNFSSKSAAEWNPKEVGNYTILVDVKDANGNVRTKSISYTISPVKWNLDKIEITPNVEQQKGKTVELEAITSGTTSGLTYKYVWMKDNWKEWGVIRNFNENASVEWQTPGKSGKYTIFVDVKGRDGEVKTRSKEYNLVSQIWEIDKISINGGNSGEIYTPIPIKAEILGDKENLQYKYVWQKDNWREWGVIRDFGINEVATWYPKETGTYTIITNVKDLDGRVKTLAQEYEVSEASWQLEQIEVEADGSYFVGDNVTVTAVTSGNNEGLKYKFVQKNGDDWSDWKVLREFDSNNTVTVDIEKAGKCTIYVDIMNEYGMVFPAETKVLTGYEYVSASASKNRISMGESIVLSPKLSSSVEGIQCKFVWMKDDWAEWGVIRELGDETSVEWKPEEPGKYYIYIDVKLNDVVKSKCVVVDARTYLRPSNYYPINDYVALPSGGYNVSTANIGLKVIEVNRRLLGSTSASYTSQTVSAVKKFQKEKGLSQTGVVDLQTWLAMGYTTDAWNNLGTYRIPIKVTADSTKNEYIEAMLTTAKQYADAGTEYRIGCSGVPGTYADCSGLIYQCLYSVGISPNLNIVDHALAKYEYASYYLAKDSQLGATVDYSDMQKGDLVFYCRSGKNTVCHIAIYAGDGMIYDSWPGRGVTKRSVNISGYTACKVVRVIV